MEKIEQFGFEDVIAKRRDSIYTPGKSPGSWVKRKIKASDEFIVGGYEPGTTGFDDLAVGRFKGKELMFVARVDDGFVPNTRRQVFEAIKKLKTDKWPFVNVPEKKGMHKLDREKMEKMVWVKPKVVVEIAFNEWTPTKHLRHAEFRRLRPDQKASDPQQYPE